MRLGSPRQGWFVYIGHADFRRCWTIYGGFGFLPNAPECDIPWRCYWQFTPSAWLPKVLWKDTIFGRSTMIRVPYGIRAFGRCMIFLRR